MSDKCFCNRTLLQASFWHFLISLTSFRGMPNSIQISYKTSVWTILKMRKTVLMRKPFTVLVWRAFRNMVFSQERLKENLVLFAVWCKKKVKCCKMISSGFSWHQCLALRLSPVWNLVWVTSKVKLQHFSHLHTYDESCRCVSCRSGYANDLLASCPFAASCWTPAVWLVRRRSRTLTVTEEHKLAQIFGPKRCEVTGE